jgi:hypothetical protein
MRLISTEMVKKKDFWKTMIFEQSPKTGKDEETGNWMK